MKDIHVIVLCVMYLKTKMTGGDPVASEKLRGSLKKYIEPRWANHSQNMIRRAIAGRFIIIKGESHMELFNIICGICSIAGLAVSVFTASKVIKISNVNKSQISKTENTVENTSIGGDYVGKDKITSK